MNRWRKRLPGGTYEWWRMTGRPCPAAEQRGSRKRKPLLAIVLAALSGLALCPGIVSQAAESATAPDQSRGSQAPPADLETVQVRGRVICLAEEMHRAHAAELPSNHEHVWGFKAADGRIFTLLRGKYSEAIFLDEQVRAKELLLTARLFPNSQILEVQHLRSVRDGAVQELFYYCDICSIKSVSPEICSCCREPVRLVEQPENP